MKTKFVSLKLMFLLIKVINSPLKEDIKQMNPTVIIGMNLHPFIQ